MLHEFERHVGFYRLRVASIPDSKERIPLSEAMDQIFGLFEIGDAVWIHERQRQSVRLLDIRMDHPEYYVLLISLTKVDIADPAFEHIVTGEFRVEEKDEGEGISYSAHLLIYKSEDINHGGVSHSVCLERVPGLSSSLIRPFLAALLRSAYEVNQRVYWYKGENRRYRARFTLNGDLATTLGQQMGRSRITGVELIDHRNVPSGLDEHAVLREKKAVLSLKVEGEHHPATIIRSINSIRTKARAANFDEVKIKVISDETGEQTIPIEIDIDTDAAETLAVRKEKVEVDNRRPLGQRHAEIRNDLVELIHALPKML